MKKAGELLAATRSLEGREWNRIRWTGMVLLTLLAVAFVFPPVLKTSAHSIRPQSDDSGRKISEIRKDVRAFVARSRKAKTDSDLTSAVFDMCRLHQEIVADPRFETNRDLQGLRAQLWQRLKTVKNSLNQKIARETRQREKELRARGISDPEKSDFASANQPSPGDFDFLADEISQQISFANQMTGGPSQVFAYAGGKWAGPPDNGPELVRLIEETINPDFWERNGGPGRIRYYKPLMIIVVTGTNGVHDNISKMLRTLRSISR